MTYSSERIGELLVRVGLISPDQLEAALIEQENSGGKLGEVLVRELVLTESQIAEALAQQKGLEHVNLAAVEIDAAVATLLPVRIARRKAVIPISLDGECLTVAMADPLDVEAMDEVEIRTGLKVHPVVADASQVRYAIEKYIAGHNAMQGLDVGAVGGVRLPTEHDVVGSDEDVPVIRIVNQLIREAVIERASDVHFEPTTAGVRVRYRIDGVLRDITTLPASIQPGLLSRLKVMAEMDITERRRPQEGRIALRADDRALDLRVSTLPTPIGEGLVLRVLDAEVAFRPFDEIGISPEAAGRLERMLRRPHGALLVSGPTGSGKSTTLYALLNEINDSARKIITIEDPVEYRMDGITQLSVNKRAGLTFASGLRAILRADPDVVMVGEVRDPETAEIAVRAALTGHLVLTSIHTNDAPSSLTRLNDMGVPPYITSSGLLGTVAQRLVRVLCPHCKEVAEPPAEALLHAGFSADELAGLTVYRPVGCTHCAQTGYRGRTGVFEVMEFDEHLSNLFIKNAAAEELRALAMEQGMRPLRRDALDKVAAGITSLDEVARVVN